MYQIPTSLQFNGAEHKIRNNGDYRVILDCFAALNDEEIDRTERLYACLIIFYEELEEIEDLESLGDIEEAIKAMFDFFRCGQPESTQTSPYKLIDWEGDEQMICAAINPIANTEIRTVDYMHWWTFMGYYNSIGKSMFSTVVSIRDKIVKGTKKEKWENQFIQENPQYFNWKSKSADMFKEDEELRALWESNS